jgi:chlorophyll/bacteriochlorophyll a synthase
MVMQNFTTGSSTLRQRPSIGTPPFSTPTPLAILELLKPVTWFPPMWAYLCGAVSAGLFANLNTAGFHTSRLAYVIGGVVLAGPMVCGTSQAINDWFDRHVDAINEPNRVIPSGRMPGRWGLHVAVAGTFISTAFAATLGLWVFIATLVGLAAAWAYSAPPLRLKLNGWFGNGAVGFSYESLPWFTAAAATLGFMPAWQTCVIALLYGFGAHGILTLNDFKAIKGDTQLGVASLPVQLGAKGAAYWTAFSMLSAQGVIVALLLNWGKPSHALAIAGLTLIQAALLFWFSRKPVERALTVSALGVFAYITGMMVTATALPAITGLAL